MIRQGWMIVLLAGMTLAWGCEKSSPPKVMEKPPTDVEVVPPPPTTQELMSGKYKKLPLTPLPLTAEVPESWSVETTKGTTLTTLEGPGIDGRKIQMSLTIGTPMTADRLKNVLDGIKRAATRESQSNRSIQVRDAGDVKILEEQRTFAGATQPDEQTHDWKVTYFVHTELDYSQYVVDVIGLTAGQYEQSKDLLRKIFDSITYQPPPGG